MNIRILVASLLSFVAGAVLFSSLNPSRVQATSQPQPASDNRDGDREAIRAHIGSIFQAFIDWDVDKIFATHAEDWRGYLEGSRVPIKGIDEYMRANGIDWPADKGSKPQPDPTRTYSMKDFDVKFYGPDLAVACFMGDFEKKGTNPTEVLNRFRIMDVYAKREGGWIQVASHTVVDPVWRAERMSQAATVQPQMRERVLKAREVVWRAFFTNDQATLERVIPAETISIDAGSQDWGNRASILENAKRLADSGAKLLRLEFPKTEMQVYGNAIILYTTYLYELELNGQRKTTTGRGTEIFVRRGNELVNSGWHLDHDN